MRPRTLVVRLTGPRAGTVYERSKEVDLDTDNLSVVAMSLGADIAAHIDAPKREKAET